MKNPDAVYPPLPDKNYFAIGEAARLALTKPHIIRYWEKKIVQLAHVSRHNGARRYYTAEDIVLLRKINDSLNKGGYTIDGVRARLAGEHNRKRNSVTKNRRGLRREIEQIMALL